MRIHLPIGNSAAEPNPCPVRPVSCSTDGGYLFVDPCGQHRLIIDLDSSSVLRSLFRGDESWLRERFPRRLDPTDEGSAVVGFQPKAAAAWLRTAFGDLPPPASGPYVKRVNGKLAVVRSPAGGFE